MVLPEPFCVQDINPAVVPWVLLAAAIIFLVALVTMGEALVDWAFSRFSLVGVMLMFFVLPILVFRRLLRWGTLVLLTPIGRRVAVAAIIVTAVSSLASEAGLIVFASNACSPPQPEVIFDANIFFGKTSARYYAAQEAFPGMNPIKTLTIDQELQDNVNTGILEQYPSSAAATPTIDDVVDPPMWRAVQATFQKVQQEEEKYRDRRKTDHSADARIITTARDTGRALASGDELMVDVAQRFGVEAKYIPQPGSNLAQALGLFVNLGDSKGEISQRNIVYSNLAQALMPYRFLWNDGQREKR